MSSAPKAPLVVGGWVIFAHPLFLDQHEKLLSEIEQARAKDPTGFRCKSFAKRPRRIAGVAFKIIREKASPA